MAIKIKNRDPKSTEFTSKDIVININEGTMFYKTPKDMFKIQGDNLNTAATEFTAVDNLIIDRDLTIKGSIIPSESGSFDLGSRTNPWRDIHIMTSSVKFYDTSGEVGKISFERGRGLQVKDDANLISSVSASIVIATDRIKSPTGSFEHYLGIDGGSF